MRINSEALVEMRSYLKERDAENVSQKNNVRIYEASLFKEAEERDGCSIC